LQVVLFYSEKVRPETKNVDDQHVLTPYGFLVNVGRRLQLDKELLVLSLKSSTRSEKLKLCQLGNERIKRGTVETALLSARSFFVCFQIRVFVSQAKKKSSFLNYSFILIAPLV